MALRCSRRNERSVNGSRSRAVGTWWNSMSSSGCSGSVASSARPSWPAPRGCRRRAGPRPRSTRLARPAKGDPPGRPPPAHQSVAPGVERLAARLRRRRADGVGLALRGRAAALVGVGSARRLVGGVVAVLGAGQHLGVAGLGGHQLGVRARGHDAPVLEQDHPVGQADGRQPVGDHDGRAALQQRRQGGVDLGLDLHVDGAGGVVEHEQPGVHEQGAGDGDALALTARQRVAPLADDAVVAVGQLADEVVGLRGAGGGDDLVERRVGPAVGDVVAHRHREQERLVEHQPHVASAGWSG